MPFPLGASNFYREGGVAGIAHGNQHFGCWYGHDDQNQEWQYGPDNFNRGAFVKLGGFLAIGFSVLEHGIEHHTKHHKGDGTTDVEDQHM